MERQEALTRSYSGLTNRVIIPVGVTNDKGVTKEFPGLIDTGATHTCISSELATEMELVSVGNTISRTAQGSHETPIYIVDLSLWDGRVRFSKHKVIMASLTQQEGVEMLIGMDILTTGDFALTNKDGKTMATFRVPSMVALNFVPEAERANKFAVEKAKREANRAKKNR